MLEIYGKLVDSKKNKFISHTIAASFEEKSELEDSNNTESKWISSQVVVPVSNEGIFLVKLPEKEEMRGKVVLDVVAPDGEHLASEEFAVNNLTPRLTIKVDAKVFPKILKSEDPFLGKRVKLTGRVIDTQGKQVSNKQVSLWGIPLTGDIDNGNQNPELVLVTQSDKQGYFSAIYPKGEFSEAYGIVSAGSNEKIPINLKSNVYPMKVVLVVKAYEDHEGTEKEACFCDTEIPRSPDTEDLINSPETFSTDIGVGKCVDLTIPNRALEEFSFYTVARTTEPQIKGLTLAEPMKIPLHILNSFSNDMKMSTNAGSKPNRTMKIKNVDAGIIKALMVDADRFTPETVMSAQKLSTYKKFDSFLDTVIKKWPGRANLTASNPIDWDDTPTFYQATSIAHGHILHMKQVWKADGYSLGDLLYSLPLAPCQKKEIAVIDWDRKEKAGRTELLEEEEQLQALISRDRDISEIVNSSLRESMTGSSFAHTEGDSLGGGLGFSGEGTIGIASIGVGGVFGFSSSEGSASSFATQQAARKASAESLQKLRDTTMQSASAIRSQRSSVVQTLGQGETMRVQSEVVANHNHCHAITIEYFEVLRHFQVFQELVDVQECLFIPLLMSRFDSMKALRWRETLARVLRNRSLRRGFDSIERILNNYEGSDFPEGRYSQERVEYLEGELKLSFHFVRPKDKEDGTIDYGGWNFFEPFLTNLNGVDSVFNLFFDNEPSQAERDKIWQSEIAPNIAEEFVQSLEFFVGGPLPPQTHKAYLDPTLVSNYSSNTPLLVSLRQKLMAPYLPRESITRFVITTKYEIPPKSKVIVHSGSVRYRTKYMSHFLFRDYNIKNDLMKGDGVQIPTFPDREELRDPRKEDIELKNKLLAHLNEHVEYYHRMIWWRMDKDRRYMLLDGYIAPNSTGKSVASVVENRLLGIVGNCLVMPVSRGIKLDPTFKQDKEDPIDLLEHYAPTTPIPPMRISVPTKGVFAESVMGSCNSCEFKEDARFWRFEESPCGDEPTPIAPISTESRRAEPADLKAKDFPAPIVAFQNTPPAPDPTGIAAAFNLLGTPNLFKDITGLDENQKNAIAALTANVDAVKFYTQKAAELAARKGVSSDLDKTMRAIKEAEKDGTITKDQSNELAMSALGTVSDLKNQKADTKLMDRPEVGHGIEQASKKGQGWSASEDGDNVEVKEKSGPDQKQVDLDVHSHNSAESRSFFPNTNDKTNEISMEVIVSNLPNGANVRWKVAKPNLVTLLSENATRTKIKGNEAGLTEITVEATGPDGKTILSDAITSLSVPQFVEVITPDNIGIPSFDDYLDDYHVLDSRDEVLNISKEVVEKILDRVNVRVVWNVTPVNEQLPEPYNAIMDLNEAHHLQVTVTGGVELESFDENYKYNNYGMVVSNTVWLGSLSEPQYWSDDHEIPVMLNKLKNSNTNDPQVKDLLIKTIGRMTGTYITRLILIAVHKNLIDSNWKIDPPIAGHILNGNKDSYQFRDLTGIRVLDLQNFPEAAASYEDSGIGAIVSLTPESQTKFDTVLPIPPEFE